MAMRKHGCNTVRIAHWTASRALLEATGHCHGSATCSVSPRRPPGWQQTKQWWQNAPTLLAVLMAVVVRGYNTAHINQWRRSTASLEATGCCHWASIAADSSTRSCIHRCFMIFEVDVAREGTLTIWLSNIYTGVWHINGTRRERPMWWNTYMGGINKENNI